MSPRGSAVHPSSSSAVMNETPTAPRRPAAKRSDCSSAEQPSRNHPDSDADLLAALSFTPLSNGGFQDRFSSEDDWSDPREPPGIDMLVSPLTALNELWVSPLPNEHESSPTEASGGVKMPPLLKELLGVDFLPQFAPANMNADIESLTLESTVENDVENILNDDDSVANAAAGLANTKLNLNLGVVLDQPSTNEPTLASGQKDTKGRRRSLTSKLGKLTSKVRKNGERRKQRRRDRLEERDNVASQKSSWSSRVPKGDEIGNRERAATEPVDLEVEAWTQSQRANLAQQTLHLEAAHAEIETAQLRSKAILTHISQVQKEVAKLEASLAESMSSLDHDKTMLAEAKKDLIRFEAKRQAASRAVQATKAAIQSGNPPSTEHATRDDDPVLNPMLATPPTSNILEGRRRTASASTLHRSSSDAFIRIHDLEMDSMFETSSSVSDLSSGCCTNAPSRDFAFLDNEVKSVLDALIKFGFELATDETKRFAPMLNTEKLIAKCSPVDQSWPIRPWYPAFDKEVLVWSGLMNHDGHGNQWPVVKARGIVTTAPRNLIELVLDSQRVLEYNRMSQGRTDVVYLQEGLDTTAEESDYCIAGEAKIVQSISKAPMIRRGIEMLSLLYARFLEDVEGSLLSVSRSVWEDESGSTETSHEKVRSEISLSVNLVRPVKGPKGEEHCELTTITHVHTSVVPEYLHRKVGPAQAAKVIRDFQAAFR